MKKDTLKYEIKNLKKEKNELTNKMLQKKGKDEMIIESLQKEIVKYNKVCEDCKQTYIELSYDYNKLKRELGNLQKDYDKY